jgi:hypothetical protein
MQVEFVGPDGLALWKGSVPEAVMAGLCVGDAVVPPSGGRARSVRSKSLRLVDDGVGGVLSPSAVVRLGAELELPPGP